MKKLTLTAATTAALLCAGFASNLAKAEDWNYPQSQNYAAPIIGEGGAHWGSQCWVETWGGGTSYFGYWKPCAPAPAPRTAARR